MKILLLANGQVGFEICTWLIRQYRQDIGLVVTCADNEIKHAVEAEGLPCVTFKTERELIATISELGQSFDWGVLAWWPYIIHTSLMKIPRHGFINTHPSLLPFNRGKHYNFWALVEQAPFGVSLHFVGEGIDCGDVVAQMPIAYDWEDDGGTLYQKAARSMVELFKRTYPLIKEGRFTRQPQDLGQGSYHRAEELDLASRIDLNAEYQARDLLNLLRARTFPGHPACWFKEEDGEEFEVRVEIRRKER